MKPAIVCDKRWRFGMSYLSQRFIDRFGWNIWIE